MQSITDGQTDDTIMPIADRGVFQYDWLTTYITNKLQPHSNNKY